MALVQKKLVKLLDARNNRFRIGFLSSFESLQESIKQHGQKCGRGRGKPDRLLYGEG